MDKVSIRDLSDNTPKQCAFCNTIPTSVHKYRKTYSVVCQRCLARGPVAVSAATALDHWNTGLIKQRSLL